MTATNAKPRAAENPTEREFIITRVFDAPRELVWKAWTEAEHLNHWWGPKGFTPRVAKLELKPGGTFLYQLRSADGQEMWGKFVYREIVAPERLVFVVSFSDAKGGVTRHPMSPEWPLQTLSTVTFAERDGKTTVTVRWLPHEASDAERRTFEDGRDSMRQGWTGTLDQLTAYLVKGAADTSQGGGMPMPAKPQKEHEWLHKLFGEWTFEGECSMGPDQPPMKNTGTESVRSLGGLWTVGEGRGEMPGGGAMTSIMTLGYDPAKGHFVGSFVASMMTHLWIYERGALDAAGKVLTLDARGPSFSGDGTMADYQDIIEFKSDDHRTLSSRMKLQDGNWSPIFMTAHYRRKR